MENILIVEDVFIEANTLRLILEEAGHQVCGIAKSVDEALEILKSEKPDIVLLDIYLKGNLTGIDLAKILIDQHIPFIFLSANSNASTLEAAKATQPYGFMVKPFREKEILVALDIASYRHKHIQELSRRQELWLTNLLLNVISVTATAEQKLLQMAKAFVSFFPFDMLIIDADLKNENPGSVYSFQRVAYDEYIAINGLELLDHSQLTSADFNKFRKSIFINTKATLTDEPDPENESIRHKVTERLKEIYSVKSGLSVPVNYGNNHAASLTFFSTHSENFNKEHVELLNSIQPLLAKVIENIRIEREKINSLATGKETRLSLQIKPKPVAIEGIIGKSQELMFVLDQVARVAPVDTTVLILGETGVGKEGLANGIHQLSNRRSRPMIKVNCAAIPSSLIESELFGHEKGAFTGATERRIGKFEQAHGGTIFLDEIGEIPLEIQSKLLRVLQEKELERVGGRSTIKIDIRIIAATNRNLYKEVAAGKFRMDLYYRINVFPINLPALRDRKEDIPLLVNHFLEQNAALLGIIPKKVTPGVLQQLMAYSWPGNIRELQYLIERHMLTSNSMIISSIELPKEQQIEEITLLHNADFKSIADVDKAHILAALEKCNGKISGKGGAAEILKIPSATLHSKMKKLGIGWKFFFE